MTSASHTASDDRASHSRSTADDRQSLIDIVDLAEFARRGAQAHRKQLLFSDAAGALTGHDILDAVNRRRSDLADRPALQAVLQRWIGLLDDASSTRATRHRAGAFTAAAGAVLHGIGDGRWLVGLSLHEPHARGIVDAVLGGAWATGSPVFAAPADADASQWMALIDEHKPLSLITGPGALDGARQWLAHAAQSGVQRWTILLPAELAHKAADLERQLGELPPGVHVQWVIADAWAGFIAVRAAGRPSWRAALTVGLRTENGILHLQSPQILASEPAAATIGIDVKDGWLRTRLRATSRRDGITIDGLDDATASGVASADTSVGAFSLAALFERASAFSADRPAIRFDALRITYGTLRERAHRLASALHAFLHVGAGDRVAFLSRNRPEFVELYWALNHVGAIFVPVNFRLKAQEVAYILRDSGARHLFIEPGNDELVVALAAELPDLHVLHLPDVPTHGLDSGYESLIEAARNLPSLPAVQLGDDAAASILYTAGTTGFPKGAVRSNKNAFWFTLTGPVVASLLQPDDSHLLSTPMFHVAGHEAAMLGALLTATQQVIMHEVRADEFLEFVREEKIGYVFVPPTIGLDLVRRLREGSRAFDHLNYWNSASAPLPAVLRDEVMQRLPNLVFRNSLGMTEAGALLRQGFAAGSTKPANTIGRPLGTVDAQIVDGDCMPVAAGEIGEIVVRTPQSVTRYWNNEAASQQATFADWFHTGDLGRVDEDGDVQIMGRVKEMIISGGENVYSTEVENTLFSHPGIREAAVFGVPHPRWGEAVVAAVVPEAGAQVSEQDLIAHCRQRIAHYKSPLRIFVEQALPRNSMGKVMKFQLQQDHQQTWA